MTVLDNDCIIHVWLFLCSITDQFNCLFVVVFLGGTGDLLGSEVEEKEIFKTRRLRYALLPMEDPEFAVETNQQNINGSEGCYIRELRV